MTSDFAIFPEQASTVAREVDALYLYLVVVSGFFTSLIFFLVIFFAAKYRRRAGQESPPPAITGNLRLEVLWTVVPFALSLVMFGWGARLYFVQAQPPDDAVPFYVVAKQWMWKLQHVEGPREIDTLHVPVGQPVKLIMTSEDVIHSFYVPAFRTKMDVVPGTYTTTWFEPTRTGEYDLFCAEYCGTNHSRMVGRIVVMEPSDYATWLSGGAKGESMAVAGERIFEQRGCASCHTETASARGPSLHGLFGKEVRLKRGATVVADEAYLRESILDPGAKVVEGYEPIMPAFEGLIGEENVLKLIEYIKSLSPEEDQGS